METDIPARLERVRRMKRDGVHWIHAQDFLRAIRAPAKRGLTSGVPVTDKIRVREQRGGSWMQDAIVLYISPAAACRLAVDYAPCPNALIRAWAYG